MTIEHEALLRRIAAQPWEADELRRAFDRTFAQAAQYGFINPKSDGSDRMHALVHALIQATAEGRVRLD